MRLALALLLLPLALVAQIKPELPESVSALADLRRTYTGEFAALQRDFKNAKDPAALAIVQDKLLDLTAKIHLLRGQHRYYFEGYSSGYSEARERPYGVLGVLIKKHSLSRGDKPRAALLQRLQATLHELRELPVPRSSKIGPAEINQLQRVLDKMHEAFVLDGQIR